MTNQEKTKILIIDDELPARLRMKDLISDIQEECACELVGEAQDGQTALDLILERQPDLLLLDVQMPGMTGIELAQHIVALELELTPAIIFVTAYDEFALQAFEVHAMDYLLKPVKAQRLQDAIMRIQAFQQNVNQHEAVEQNNLKIKKTIESLPKIRQNFSVLERNRVLLVPIHEVLFLKAEQKYVTIQTKERSYLTEESLVSIESDLSDIFVRAHRNALVARSAIVGVEKASHHVDAENESEKTSESWQVIVRDSSEKLPISRRQWPVIKALVR